MYYVYYNDTGSITAVVNIIDSSFGDYYIEVDLDTYTDLSNGTKQISDFAVIDSSKVKGKKIIVSKAIEHVDLIQPNGIINKLNYAENAIILNQDQTNRNWTVSSTMDDENCTMFLLNDSYIKEYYVVDPKNRFILLDTLQVDLKDLAAHGTVTIEKFNKDICKQDVVLLCNSHHVKHIHNVQE